jgi:hypothetical protein
MTAGGREAPPTTTIAVGNAAAFAPVRRPQ